MGRGGKTMRMMTRMKKWQKLEAEYIIAVMKERPFFRTRSGRHQ
jgi:hypothetical protein